MVETTFSFVSSKWFDYESSGYTKIKRLWGKKKLFQYFLDGQNILMDWMMGNICMGVLINFVKFS